MGDQKNDLNKRIGYVFLKKNNTEKSAYSKQFTRIGVFSLYILSDNSCELSGSPMNC